jgi:hypothetical protein
MPRTPASAVKTGSENSLRVKDCLTKGMLTIVEELLPCGMNNWEQVAARYNQLLPNKWSPRDADSIKRKFNLLKGIILFIRRGVYQT